MSFRILFLSTVTLLVMYTSLCVRRVLPHSPLLSLLITLVIPLFIIGVQILIRKRRVPQNFFGQALIWIASIGLGWWATFTLFFMILDILSLLLLGISFIIPSSISWALALHDSMHPVATGILFASFLAAIFGFIETLLGPRIVRIKIPVAGLPEAVSGLRIVQLSDLHIGATIHRDYIGRVVKRALALKPDLIAVTGDVADGEPKELRAHTEPLARLKAPLGTFYITGNHEYYSGVTEWIKEMTRVGFIPLLNENRIVLYNGEAILVAGVTDLGAHHFIPSDRSDPVLAAKTSENCALKLLLAHQPESCIEAAGLGFHLQLSGHTHGGQFFPFSLLVRLVKRFAKGLYRYKDMLVYVNAGTGYWGAANRLFVPAEITLLEIISA